MSRGTVIVNCVQLSVLDWEQRRALIPNPLLDNLQNLPEIQASPLHSKDLYLHILHKAPYICREQTNVQQMKVSAVARPRNEK